MRLDAAVRSSLAVTRPSLGPPGRVTYLHSVEATDGPRLQLPRYTFDGVLQWLGQRAKAPRISRPIEVIPGIRSDEPTWRAAADELGDTLTHALPASKTEKGFYRMPAIPGDFRALRTVAGLWMNPAGSPPLERKTKATDYAHPAHRRLLSSLVRVLTARWEAAHYHISRISSYGLPFMTPDVRVKLEGWRNFFAAAPHVRAAMKTGDATALWEKYLICLSYTVGRRVQADKFILDEGTGLYKPKARPVYDHLGNWIAEADKAVLLASGQEAFAARTRLVYAASGSWNYALGGVWSGVKNYIRRMYAYTYTHSSAKVMLRKMAAWGFGFSLDVKNFDQSIPRFLLEDAVALARPFESWVQDFTIAALHFPVLIQNDYEGGRGLIWSGDPLDLNTHKTDVGNPSGMGPNFYFNYVMGSFLVLVAAFEAGILSEDDITEEGLDRVLKGEHARFSFWNSGDDNVLLFKREEDHRALWAYFGRGDHPYFDVEVEPGMAFLGTLFGVAEDGTRYATANPVSQALNFWVPERDFFSPHRKYAAYGYNQRKLAFASSPASKQVDVIINDVFERHFGKTLDSWIRPFVVPPTALGRVGLYDLAFMLNPNIIHYRDVLSKISPKLLDEMFLTIPKQELSALAGPLLR